MKYMMLFWVDESAETTADEDAAMMVAVTPLAETSTMGVDGLPLSSTVAWLKPNVPESVAETFVALSASETVPLRLKKSSCWAPAKLKVVAPIVAF